jgi:hypothetical protein
MIIATAPSFLKQGFITNNYAVRDTSLTSPTYFDITYFPEFIGGGKSLIKLKGNGINLLRDKLSEVEILDAQGNPIYYEVPTYIDRFENYYISIHVYDTTAPGIGSISIVGVATQDLQGRLLNTNNVNDLGHNVIWTRPIKILPFERNNSDIVFDDPPQVFVSQVISPAKISFQENTSTQFSAITGSGFTIKTSNFKGFDKKLASSFKLKANKIKQTVKDKITDNKIKQISTNVDNKPFTVNSVNTKTRTTNQDIVGGFILNETNRYNTVLIASESFFSSSYLGATVAFFNASYSLSPSTSSTRIVSNTNPYDELETTTTQSIAMQLERWRATIVNIKDEKTAYLDQPVQIDLQNSFGSGSRGNYVTHTYQTVTDFTASILYSPETLLYTTSSEVSQSYIQFTMQDVRPIGGDIYKIRVYYRRGSETGDWSLLQDQIVNPVEFLTDARYPNQTNYAADLSDYYLLGYFTDYSVLENNWSIFNDLVTTFDTTTSSIDNSVLMGSVKLISSASINNILTTKYYQNYPEKKVFSLMFNCVLDPYTELEIYQNSETLQTTVFNSDPFPRAFDKTLNYELARYSDRFNRFGKLIGKIQNNTSIRKNYQRVVFDFKTDSEGLGRPLFRVKQYDPDTIASAFISNVNLTPRQLNGFTPSTIEFAFPAKLDTNIYLNETIDYKLEYYDYTGNQSEYITYLENITMELTSEVPTNACQSEIATFKFNPFKYYLCDYTRNSEATQSVLLNYPEVGKISYITGSSGATLPTASLSDLPAELRLWPDWDLRPISGHDPITIALDGLYKGWQNYILGTPNFLATTSESFGDIFTVGNFWNALRPSMSIIEGSSLSSYTRFIPQYPLSWSLDLDGAGPIPIFSGSIADLSYGTVTSSWNYIDRFTAAYVPGTWPNPTPPAGFSYSKNVYRFAYESASVDTIDSRIFYEDGGLGITYLNVSNSFHSFSIATTDSERTEALKKRRLYWPTLASTYALTNYFTQNGGIYNVKFKLKKLAPSSYNPDVGSFMNVFIFDVASNFTVSSSGIPGWYPPPQNIVKIGNQYSAGGVTTPAISFIDSATGYQYDEYNINLIQYGAPAQLVFEPAGVDNSWFGIIIDDVQFCKIGVTTDPFYIRPQLVNNNSVLNNLPNVNNLPAAQPSER